MAYSDFTLSQIKSDLGITLQEGVCFFPPLQPIAPSEKLRADLEEGLPWAIAVGTEKARSESIINPVLLEVRRYLKRQVSVFSGERLDVDAKAGLTGTCDFIISRSPEQLELEAPLIVLVEAKKADLKLGLAQCLAEMVAAARFNQQKGRAIDAVYGAVTSGTQWRFMRLVGQTAAIDLTDYPLPPVEPLLAQLVWMIEQG
jgi:hypothetical protein